MAPNIIALLTVSKVFANKHSENSRDGTGFKSRRDTTNSTNYLLDYRIVHRVFNDPWIVLKNLVCIYCYVYLDDVIISQTEQEHARRLENILHRFERANLQLNPNKCVIAQPLVNCLGYVLSEKRVSASTDKVRPWGITPLPRTLKTIAHFGPSLILWQASTRLRYYSETAYGVDKEGPTVFVGS